MKTQVRGQPVLPEKEWTPSREILPLILGQDPDKKLGSKEEARLEIFEKGLAKELKKEDSIRQAIGKMVKMALAAEFGPSLVAASGARPMVETIVRAILSDAQLRRQALIIIDRFTNG
jgi:hypothetical protein